MHCLKPTSFLKDIHIFVMRYLKLLLFKTITLVFKSIKIYFFDLLLRFTVLSFTKRFFFIK